MYPPTLLSPPVQTSSTRCSLSPAGPALVDEVLDQHPERRAPVAEVVAPDHLVAEELPQAHDRVPDDRRAQVPDVHLLGHVRADVVDHDPLRRRDDREAYS